MFEVFAARFALVRRAAMAEREGFEPSVEFLLRIFSKDVLSTTQPPLLARDQSQNQG